MSSGRTLSNHNLNSFAQRFRNGSNSAISNKLTNNSQLGPPAPPVCAVQHCQYWQCKSRFFATSLLVKGLLFGNICIYRAFFRPDRATARYATHIEGQTVFADCHFCKHVHRSRNRNPDGAAKCLELFLGIVVHPDTHYRHLQPHFNNVLNLNYSNLSVNTPARINY